MAALRQRLQSLRFDFDPQSGDVTDVQAEYRAAIEANGVELKATVVKESVFADLTATDRTDINRIVRKVRNVVER